MCTTFFSVMHKEDDCGVPWCVNMLNIQKLNTHVHTAKKENGKKKLDNKKTICRGKTVFSHMFINILMI